MAQLRDLSIYILAVGVADVVDMLLVATLVYGLLYVVRGTRAVQLLRGLLIVVLLVFTFNQFLSLPAFERVVSKLLPAILISVPVIFQPELRRAFERLGQAGLLTARPADKVDHADWVAAVVAACRHLSDLRHGALIVVERQTSLEELCERALPLDAVITSDLLVQVFVPNSPLHDGAAVLGKGRLIAARVVLPINEALPVDPALGTRHLAAVSIATSTDAIAAVVSEETGTISLAIDGQLVRCADAAELSRLLHAALAHDGSSLASRRWRALRDAWAVGWRGGAGAPSDPATAGAPPMRVRELEERGP